MKRILLLACLAAAAPAMAAYKCVDEKGVSHYEDVPPAACANVVITEVSASGSVVRRIEPQRAGAPAPDAKKKPENDRAALDRQRRDRTLLDTFANEREIDTARDRSLDLIKSRRASAESQLALVKKRRKQVEASRSASKADVENVVKEQATVEHTLAGYDAEMERVRKQFEQDKVRWRELKESSGRR